MKKLLFTFIIIVPVGILLSFMAKPAIDYGSMAQNRKTVNRKKNLFDWGAWRKVSCYKGIQFRVSRGEYYNGQYMWHVQFRNLYNKEVRFGWNLVDPEKEAVTRRDRIVLDVWRMGASFDPDEDGNNRDAPHGGNWANASSDVFVYITNVQFSSNGNWDTPIIDCDY